MTNRLSGMELLRIIAMLLVMTVHIFCFISIHDAGLAHARPLASLTLFGVDGLSVVCVDVFVLISGWFGVRLRLRSLARLVFQTLFFSILVCTVLVIYDSGKYMNAQSLSTILLLNGNDYWFVKAYIGLLLLSPALNLLVERCSRRELGGVLFLMAAFQTVYGWLSIDGAVWIAGGYSAFSFVVLYLLARYVRLYLSEGLCGGFARYFGLYLAIGLGQALLGFALTRAGLLVAGRLFTYTNPLVIIQSMALVVAFSRLHFSSRPVNVVASCSLAVYLLHANELVLRPIYARTIADWFYSVQFPSFLIRTAALVLVVYAVAILIDLVRQWLWRKVEGIKFAA